MKIEEVGKLSPMDQLIYWIRERHQIALKKNAGLPPPWTDDEILRSFFFTNPYRENDKVTVWFRENIRDPLRDDPRVLFATVAFRWFNWIPTGQRLMGHAEEEDLLLCWDPKECIERLGTERSKGNKIFTGAFLINSPPGKPKLEAIVERIDNVWEACEDWLVSEMKMGAYEKKMNMKDAHELLTSFEGLGGFMAYEIVCDLRYTKYLEHASDKMTWCNPGPGCIRGLYRLNGWDWENKMSSHGYAPPKPKDWLDQMQVILSTVRQRLPRMPPFEMREIEHSLCEFTC